MRTTLLLSCLLAFAASATAVESTGHPTLQLGSAAPDFHLPGVDGKTYSLADFADAKLLVIVFTSVHCPTAQAYEGRIKQLVADYRPRGVAVVAINPNNPDAVRLDEQGYTDLDDTFESMKLRAADRGFNYPFLDDGPTESVTRQYGPAATPHVFIFDAARKLRFQGRIDDSEREELVKNRDTRNALDALLAGREPPVTQTMVFGCSIKWAEKAESNRRWREQVAKEPVALDTADVQAMRDLRANKSGRIRVINVWATWCGPCVSEFDQLIETNLIYRNRDFELVTVAAQFPDEKDKVLQFLQRHHASTRNLLFGETDKYKLMAALDPEWTGALPHTLVIGADGAVLFRQNRRARFSPAAPRARSRAEQARSVGRIESDQVKRPVPSIALSAQRTFGEALVPTSMSLQPRGRIKIQAGAKAAPRYGSFAFFSASCSEAASMTRTSVGEMRTTYAHPFSDGRLTSIRGYSGAPGFTLRSPTCPSGFPGASAGGAPSRQ